MASGSDDIRSVFEAATEYVRDNTSSFDSDTLLKLYARYKQVKEGECNTPKPGFLDFQGKQKWSAWKKLGSMGKHDAMREYIDIIARYDPKWQTQVSKSTDKPSSGKQMTLGVAVSTMMNTDKNIDDRLKTIFDWCKDGDTKRVSKILDNNNVNVDEKDSEGMVLLHWACDRGDTDMVATLLKHGANINSQDADGQTGLHFAMVCEHPEVVRLLLTNGANTNIPDTDGQTVQSLIPETTAEIKQIISSFPNR
ncbi:acyl-CoA-binding domain-containing protein 6-like [Ruditapes philippinarum]|uniref:acyl-CoA-binding domain-containing protein 6-like n=1 Tax=Ruditapes philippinarum TaxID=129788 RepID=UPI00295A89A6|nr:acyl-CoA-binding domain-containing protein 6-like [Ruditapes philippinarum]